MDDVNARRSSAEHDAPITRESIDQAIAVALENHRPRTDIKVIAAIGISFAGLLLTMLGGLISFSNRIAIIEERQQVNSALILKLADKIDHVDQLERNNESQITQTGQIVSDHIALDNSRWDRVGGKREHQ